MQKTFFGVPCDDVANVGCMLRIGAACVLGAAIALLSVKIGVAVHMIAPQNQYVANAALGLVTIAVVAFVTGYADGHRNRA